MSQDQELLKQIQIEHENCVNLCDGKIDTSNESFYLVEYNLRKLNELIEQFKKNINNSTLENPSSQKTTVPNTQIDENYVQTAGNNSSKINFLRRKEI